MKKSFLAFLIFFLCSFSQRSFCVAVVPSRLMVDSCREKDFKSLEKFLYLSEETYDKKNFLSDPKKAIKFTKACLDKLKKEKQACFQELLSYTPKTEEFIKYFPEKIIISTEEISLLKIMQKKFFSRFDLSFSEYLTSGSSNGNAFSCGNSFEFSSYSATLVTADLLLQKFFEKYKSKIGVREFFIFWMISLFLSQLEIIDDDNSLHIFFDSFIDDILFSEIISIQLLFKDFFLEPTVKFDKENIYLRLYELFFVFTDTLDWKLLIDKKSENYLSSCLGSMSSLDDDILKYENYIDILKVYEERFLKLQAAFVKLQARHKGNLVRKNQESIRNQGRWSPVSVAGFFRLFKKNNKIEIDG